MGTFSIGIIAGLLCTISFIPQVVKVFKTKNTRDLSLFTFITFLFGISLWMVYGIMLKEIPIVLANLTTSVLVILIIIMKIKHG